MTSDKQRARDRMIDAGEVRDDRGRRVAQLDPVKLRVLRRHDVIEAEPLRAIAEEIGPGVPRRSRAMLRVLAIGGGICCLILAIAVVDKALSSGFQEVLDSKLLTFLPLWVLVLAFLAQLRRRRLVRARHVMLRHGRCSSCGYNLAELPVDPADGVTVCPECGAAWRLRATDSSG